MSPSLLSTWRLVVPLCSALTDELTRFIEWLDNYGETSWDHQSFFAGPVGGKAKSLYYRQRLLGTGGCCTDDLCAKRFCPQRAVFFTVRFDFRSPTRIMQWASRFLYEVTGETAPSSTSNTFSDRAQELALSAISRNIAGAILLIGYGVEELSSSRRR